VPITTELAVGATGTSHSNLGDTNMVATVWGDGTPNTATEIAPADIINEQTANYTIVEGDAHKVVDYIGIGGMFSHCRIC